MPSKTDIWMPLYIGDYLADTANLDARRSGAYLHLLMWYWRTGPLENDLSSLIGIAKIRESDAPSILQALLKQFFRIGEDGYWHQKRIDSEREKWQDKKAKSIEKAKLAAESRWANHAPSISSSNAPSDANEMLGSCPSPSPLPSSLPLSPTSTEKQQQVPFIESNIFGDTSEPVMKPNGKAKKLSPVVEQVDRASWPGNGRPYPPCEDPNDPEPLNPFYNLDRNHEIIPELWQAYEDWLDRQCPFGDGVPLSA